MISPFFTLSLKSAWSSTTRPETCAPTWTVPFADSVPFAVTCAAIVPLLTCTVENVIGVGPFFHGFLIQRNATPPATMARTMMRGSQRLITTHLLEREGARSCRAPEQSRAKYHHRARARSGVRVRGRGPHRRCDE